MYTALSNGLSEFGSLQALNVGGSVVVGVLTLTEDSIRTALALFGIMSIPLSQV